MNYSGVIIGMGHIRVGTSSFADRRLLASGWYPREVDTPAARLRHYAERFDLVEVDTTRYAIPAVETTTTWATATPGGFTFDVTAFGLLTGHPTRVSALPADLRPPGGPRDRYAGVGRLELFALGVERRIGVVGRDQRLAQRVGRGGAGEEPGDQRSGEKLTKH